MHQASVFSILLFLSAGAANAAMFKWTDADGNVQYGQHPPAGAQAEHIKGAPPPASAPATPTLQQQVEALDKRLAEEAEQKAAAERKKQDADNRKINCANAKSNIEKLNYGGHRLTQMPDGTYQRLTEKQKQAEIKKNKNAIEEYCD